MKRVLWVMTAIVAIVTSCAKNNESADFLVAPSEDFTAILGGDTRTTLDGTSVKWCEDDLLTVFTKTSHNRKYEISELSDERSSATFSYVSYTGVDNTPVTSNYALYPYDAEATISGNVITTAIATEQSYVKNSTNLSYALMVAKSDNTTFTFSNAGALIRFNISKIVPDSFTLQSITLTSTANKLSGEVTIDTSADCKAVVSSTGSNSVTLANIDTAIPDAGLSLYVSLPATNFDTDDLTATITFKEGVKEFVLPAFELAQGKIKTISYTIKDADEFVGNIPEDGEDNDSPTDEPIPTNNKIWYTANEKVEPHKPSAFGANIVSNEWDPETGKGVITFDGSVTMIGNYAFDGCDKLTQITIPDSATSIGGFAFYRCKGLTSINIPDSVTSIGKCAFSICPSLKEFIGKFAIDNGRCLIIDNTIIAYAEASGNTYTIPNSATTIGEDAFYFCSSLKQVTIPDSVTTIGNVAFWNCTSLTQATIPDSVTYIGEDAFAYCESLTQVTIPNSVTEIMEDTFYGCSSLTKVTIPDSVTKIWHGAFNSCSSLTQVTIPNSVTTIGVKAFCGCSSLTQLTIGESVTAILDEAFFYCKSLTSVTIPSSVTEISYGAFYYCTSLKNVYCKATNPPSLYSDNVFDNNASGRRIIVPIGSGEAYKKKSYWSKYANDIFEDEF